MGEIAITSTPEIKLWRSGSCGRILAIAATLISLVAPDALPADLPERAPPRSASDIIKQFSQAPRNEQELARLKAELASEPPPESAFAAERIVFYSRRAEAARQLGEYRIFLADKRKLHDLQGGSNPATALDIANAAFLTGNYREMTQVREQIARDPQAYVGWRMYNNALLASWSAATGDFEKARAFMKVAEEQFRETRFREGASLHPNWLSAIEFGRGSLPFYAGKYEDAELVFRRSVVENLEGLKRGGNPEQTKFALTVTQTSLGAALVRLNRLAEAEFYAREAVQRSVTDSGHYSLSTGRSLGFLSYVFLEGGRFDEAGELARITIGIYEQFAAIRASSSLASARYMLGEILIENGRIEEAETVLSRRAADLKSDPDAAANPQSPESIPWGYALTLLGRAAEAIPVLQRLANWYEQRRGVDSMEYVATRAFEAIALAETGERKAALELFRTYVPQLAEKTFSNSSGEVASIRATLRLRRVVDAYLSLIAQSAASSPESAANLIAEAFSAADIARGSSVQRALSASSARATIRDPKLADLARREQDLGNRVASLSNILADLLSRPAEQQLPKVQADLGRDIEAMKSERTKLRADILKQFPDYADLIAPRPVSIAQVQAQLQPGEALVSIYSTAERTYVWAVPQAGTPAFAESKLGVKQIKIMVATLRRALEVGDVPLERFPRFDIELSHQLYSALLKPVEGALAAARSLIVVPHGALGQIPFALLVTEPVQPKAEVTRFAEYRGVQFLVRKYAISQIPSVSTLVTLRRAVKPALAQQAFAGFGDPVFRQGQIQAASQSGFPSMRLRNLAVGRVDAQGVPTASNEISNLSPLPDTAEEVKDIAAVLGANASRDIFLGTAASESNFRKQDLSDRRVVMFATHGLVPGDLDGLTQPALALSNPAVTGEREVDGLLTMEEVLGLKLNADWVVLSACNTAAADGKGNEAVSGLGRAFFFAGARALLVSNWPVETVSARLITTDLFRRQAADTKLSRAEALQKTLVNLIDAGAASGSDGKPLFAYAHPMFWAPFTLVGEGAAR